MILGLIIRRRRWQKTRLLRTAWAFPAAVLLLVLASACGSGQPDRTPDGRPLPVVTTTALLADLVRNVGGDLVTVTALVPPGADVHSYQSTPANSVSVSRAALVISNGGGLDEFLNQVVQGSMAGDAVYIVAAETLLESEAVSDIDGEDPHFWQNPVFAVRYIEGIRDGLIAADPENAAAYRTNFDAYKDELTKLDLDIASTLDTVDPARRHLITFHDAFGHFATRYGWGSSAIVASDASQVSPGPVVKILEQVRAQGLPAVFAESKFSSGLLKNAAKEVGVEIGVIYSDVLEGEVASYIDMMLFNAESLAGLLRSPGTH